MNNAYKNFCRWHELHRDKGYLEDNWKSGYLCFTWDIIIFKNFQKQSQVINKVKHSE